MGTSQLAFALPGKLCLRPLDAGILGGLCVFIKAAEHKAAGNEQGMLIAEYTPLVGQNVARGNP